jgi:hypothetical protein
MPCHYGIRDHVSFALRPRRSSCNTHPAHHIILTVCCTSLQVQLELGVTRFKSFMGTNMAQGWERMAPEHLSSPLGCNVLVHTSDSCIMLIRYLHLKP